MAMRHGSGAGTVTFQDGDIEFRRGKDYWRLRLDSVCLIGEFTDASGPVGDDYCVTFVQRGSGVRYVLPYDTVGCGLVMDAISHELGAPMTTALANSADFRSRVLWPEHLRDKPFLSDAPASGLLGRIGFRRTTVLRPEIAEWSAREAG
jgi:hypothetical protein